MSRIDLSLIDAALSTYIIARSKTNELWDEIGSTNDRAIELAHDGAVEGTLVLARQQTGGRGRQGRSWVSPKDSGIFASVILRPTIDASTLPLISFAAGVAAAQAIERVLSVRIGLKWVNDLVYDGRKLGGILAEKPGSQTATSRGRNAASGAHVSPGPHGAEPQWVLPSAVILGVGINLKHDDEILPPELKGRVESLDHLFGKPVDANQIVAEFCNAFEDQYNNLRHSASEIVLAEWKSYSHTLGKQIRATVGNEILEGLAEDIADSGALVLQLKDGSRQLLYAGEISIRLQDGSYS